MSTFEMTDADVAAIKQSRERTSVVARKYGIAVALVERIRGTRCMAEVIQYKGKTMGRLAVPRQGAQYHTHQTKGVRAIQRG